MSRLVDIFNLTLPLPAIEAQNGFLMGKVLTIVDASYSSPTQNKAIKDLVKAAFREQMDGMKSLVGGDLRTCDGVVSK